MGLFDKLFGNKINQNDRQKSVDFIRINLLAKLGQEKLDEGKYKEAIDYLLEFFELMNRNTHKDLEYLIQPCIFNIALSYSKSEDYTNAIVYWTKYINSNKTNFDAYKERLEAFFELDKLSEAIQDIDKALRLKPKRDDLYINKGIAFIKMGNKIEARKALSKAVEMGNNDAQKYIDNHC